MAVPTETVYGLAAHALDVRACRKIFRAKRRPADDPLIVHVLGVRAAERLAGFHPAARALAREFWPGPLTLVLPKRPIVPDLVTSGQASVAVRAPAHPLARQLLRLAGVPLAAPSANPFGYVSPTTAAHVLAGLRGRIGHVLDGGPCAVGVESTIVDARDPARLVVLRPGAVSAAALRRALRVAGLAGRVVARARGGEVLAPGTLAQHYSPRTPCLLRAKLTAGDGAVDVARIFWRRPRGARARGVFWLSERGDAKTAARRLYAVLRAADGAGGARIVCETAPRSSGALGAAINDRLARAAGRR